MQRVAAIGMLVDLPVVVMNFVVTAPTHHDQVVKAGGSALGVRRDVMSLAYVRWGSTMEAASIGCEQRLPLAFSDGAS